MPVATRARSFVIETRWTDFWRALGKYRVVDGPTDMKRKRQLAIFQRTSGQSRNQIRHKALLGDNF